MTLDRPASRFERRPGTDRPDRQRIGFANTWTFLSDVLLRAIKNHGGIGTEALQKAALETDIPDGGTPQGNGVKFYPPGHELAGQNAQAYPVVM